MTERERLPESDQQKGPKIYDTDVQSEGRAKIYDTDESQVRNDPNLRNVMILVIGGAVLLAIIIGAIIVMTLL